MRRTLTAASALGAGVPFARGMAAPIRSVVAARLGVAARAALALRVASLGSTFVELVLAQSLRVGLLGLLRVRETR